MKSTKTETKFHVFVTVELKDVMMMMMMMMMMLLR
jgi:hypothetical protein